MKWLCGNPQGLFNMLLNWIVSHIRSHIKDIKDYNMAIIV